MEHRHGNRHVIDLAVSINGQPRLYGPGRVVNVSRSGVLVRTALVLPARGRVQVQFVTRAGGVLHIHRLDGYVVRRSLGAVALEWNDPGSQDIAPLLTAAQRQTDLAPIHSELKQDTGRYPASGSGTLEIQMNYAPAPPVTEKPDNS